MLGDDADSPSKKMLVDDDDNANELAKRALLADAECDSESELDSGK